MKVNLMNAKLTLLSLCALIALAGCDRSTEEAQVVSEPQDVSELQEGDEVQETPEVQEVAAEALAEVEVEVEVEEMEMPEPTIAFADIPPLAPLPWISDPFPESGKPELVRFTTDTGDLILAIYPDAAPNAAERFLHLVEIGYYDNTPVSRVVPGFVAQFGINWREDYRHWKNENFNDDPTLFAFEPGTLAFAKAGPNTNSTQVFISYTNNNRLADPQYNFAVFGRVIEGMEIVNSFRAVGDRSGGLNQTQLWDNGTEYLESLSEKPNMILETSRMR